MTQASNVAIGSSQINSSGVLQVAGGGTGAATLTGILYGNGTGAFTAASQAQALSLIGTLPIANGGTNSTATPTSGGVGYGTGTAHAYTSAGTTGQVLTSNGSSAPTWADAGGGFPAGTRMSFQQTSAPTGWTKDTTAGINDAILRLVTGTVSNGGSTAFSTWNAQTATGATTLSTAQIPSHNHNVDCVVPSGSAYAYEYASAQPPLSAGTVTSSNQGGGGSHTHSLTQGLKYYDFIIASKN